MSLLAYVQDEAVFFWIRLFGYFLLTLLGCYVLSTFAWRAALRDTNVDKRRRILMKLGRRPTGAAPMFIGFLHPFSYGGGGGERVLYEAIRVQQAQDPEAICVVYTGDILPLENGVSKEDMLKKAHEQFNIQLDASRIMFIPLRNRNLVGDKFWPAFTLLGQAYGANRMSYMALGQLVPDVFIDTTGYAFALGPVKNFSSRIRVGAYVHYPTISSDMIQRVKSRQVGHTNASWIATLWPVTMVKWVYYQLFAAAYGGALRHADVIVCNGSWTKAHVDELLPQRVPHLWGRARLPPVHVVYPPCDTERFAELPLDGRHARTMVSVAQFRPEKEHAMQLRIVRRLLDKYPELKSSRGHQRPLRLVLIGSCRNDEDRKRLASLRALAKELLIENHVEWCVDVPATTMAGKMRYASIGLSTMVDEHFGIGVVESMAAGLLTLSHKSAGPLLDIAVPVDGEPTGFHADGLEDFVDTAYRLMSMPEADARVVRERARARATTKFNTGVFQQGWRASMWDELVPPALLAENRKLIEQRAAQKAAKARVAPAAAESAATPVPSGGAGAAPSPVVLDDLATNTEGAASTAVPAPAATVSRRVGADA